MELSFLAPKLAEILVSVLGMVGWEHQDRKDDRTNLGKNKKIKLSSVMGYNEFQPPACIFIELVMCFNMVMKKIVLKIQKLKTPTLA